MNEEYLLQLYKYISDNDTSYKNDVSFDSFRSDMSDSQYASQIYGYLNDLDSTFSDDVSVIDFIKDINTDPKQIKKKDTVVDVTSPMEPMGSTLPQEDTSGLSESEELVETEADVANPFEGMSLFKETPYYLIDKDKQKELTDLENKKFVEDIEAQSNKIAESYADELDNEFYAQEEVVNLINEANRRSKNEVQAFVDNLVSSGIDPKTEKSKKQIQDYYSLIFDRELSSDEKFNSLVSSYSDVRADKVFSRVKEYQSSAAKAKKAKDLMDNPIYETLSKIPVAKNLLDNYLLSDGLVGEASSAFMYGKPASKELVPVAETSIELKKDRARLAQMDADGVDELVEYLPSVMSGAPPSKIKFTRNQVLDRIQSSSDELASLSPDKISRALDLQKISQFLSPEDQFLEGDFTLESLGGLVGQQLANQVEIPILGTYALELGASYLDTVKEIAEYKYGEASPENIIKVIDSGEDGAADLSAAAQLSATIDAFGLIPIGKGVSVATKGAIKAGSKTASKTASETFKKTIIGRVKKQIKENIKDKIKNKAARKFIDDSYQVVKGSLIAGFSEFPLETTQGLLVSEASRKTIEGATGQELETDIEGALKEGGASFIVGSAIPFTAGSVSISGRGARDVYKSSTKSLAEKARRKIQEKSKDYLVNESPKTRVEINEIIESAKTPEDLNGIFINNDKGLEDKLTSKYNQLKDAVQEQETGDVPITEQAEGVQEVETEVREPSIQEKRQKIEQRRQEELEPVMSAMAASEQTGEVPVVNGELVNKETLDDINAKYDVELDALQETRPSDVETEESVPSQATLKVSSDAKSALDNNKPKQEFSVDENGNTVVNEVEFFNEDANLELDRLSLLAEKGRLTVDEFQRSYFGQSTDVVTLSEVKKEIQSNPVDFINSLKNSFNESNASQPAVEESVASSDPTLDIPVKEEEKIDIAESIGNSRKVKANNVKGLLDVMGGVFGLNKKQAKSAAVVGDVMVETMAKRSGISKDEMYQKIAFQKAQKAPDGSLRQDAPLTFKSTAREGLGKIQQSAATPEQWVKQIGEKGGKGTSQELDWIGLQDYLNEWKRENNAKSVPKEVVEQYINDNQIEIVEVSKAKPDIDVSELDAEFDGSGFNIRYTGKENIIMPYITLDQIDLTEEDTYEEDFNYYSAQEAAKESAIEVIRDREDGDVRYPQYQLEGGENYREVLLTLPKKKGQDYAEKMRMKYGENLDPMQIYEKMSESERETQAKLNNESEVAYKSSHWDETNILSHLRLNERTLPNGERVLFIEEVQSDWAQEGKKKGFKNSKNELQKELESIEKRIPEVEAQLDELYFNNKEKGESRSEFRERNKEFDELAKEYSGLEPRRRELSNNVERIDDSLRTPDMPYKKTDQWVGMSMRRAMQMAAQEGFDRVAWVTGDQSADRYDLSKQIVLASAIKNDDGTYNIVLEDTRGDELTGYRGSGKKMTPSEMEDTIGKELAKKLIEGADRNKGREWKNEPTNPEFFTLRGDGLKVGGEGMKAFYNSILPKVAGKEAKRFDKKAKVEVVDFGSDIEIKGDKITKGGKVVATVRDSKFGGDFIVEVEKTGERYAVKSKEEAIERFRDAVNKQLSIPVTPEMRMNLNSAVPLFQGSQGAMTAADGNYVIYALTNPNVSTPLHELAHVYENYLTEQERKTIQDWAGTNTWTTETSEKFARGFERFLAGGEVKNSKLKQAFNNFKKWLTEIYNGIVGSDIDIELNDTMKDIYNTMLGSDKKSIPLSEETLTGYDKMMNRIDDIINRMSKKPEMTKAKILDSVTKNLQSRDPAYKRATDVQREQIIRDLRSRLGVKEKAAPSAKRVTGQPARKKVTVDEYASLKSQIRLEAKAAREAVTSYKNAGKKIAEAVKALGGKGKITLRQANTVAKKILRTNFTNTKQVDALLDYVQKIYERAELAEMVSNAKGRIKQAKKNLASKVGTNTALKSAVQDLLSLDPTDVPLNLLPQYVALVQSFGERKAVLNLPEQGVVMQTANAILDGVQESFDVTTTERVEDADYDLDQAVKEIREDKIDTKNILNPDVKKLAQKLNSLTKKDVEGLVTENKDGVKNYAKVENLKSVKREMSKGYAPKLANDLAVEIESQRSYDSLENEGAIDRVQKRGITAIGRTIASIKSIITGRGITQEQLRSIPFIGTSLDNVLGNLNQTQFREKIIDPVANAFSMMTDKMQDVRNEYLQTAEYLLSNDGFVKRSRNAILKSKYKVQLYLLEKENLSNLGSNQVAPAIEFLNETIKYLSKDTSARRNMNKEILEELREEFAPNDGPLDFEKLENSLSKNEIQAATLINQAYNETSSMYEFVSSVVRGEGLKPLNNYVHHSVLKDLNEQKKDNDLTVERITKPSTKSKTIIERTPGAKAINFDPISSADRGVKMMLTDYYMTNPIREVRSLINKLKDTPDLTQYQKDAFEDLDKVFEESIEIVFGKSLESITGVNNFFNAVEELGYYAALASVPRAAAELGSNFAGAVIMNPRTFSLGVTNFSKISFDSTSVAKFAAAIGSKSRSKLAPKGIGGKIQQELTNYNVTSRNKGALNPILDKANFIAKNTTGRIGAATADLAQKLLSTPDMAISRPMYFQTFVNEFQKITGEKLTNDDLQAIADGDTKILEKYPDAVSRARDVADTAIERLSGTTNPLKQPLKYQLKVGDDAFTKVYKKANKYMASFYSVENNTATEGTIALFYSGEITRRQATSLLAMITTRMTVYMAMYAFLQNVFDQLISNALGFRQEDEEDEDYTLLTSRQLVGSISTLILRRSLGSVSSIPVMYGIEKVNEEYLGALRGGNEYDKFKNGIVYVPIRDNKSPIEQGVSMLSGAKGPALNTISRLATVISGITGSDKKETRDQYTDELLNRMSIEVLGNVGLLPFYKDIRRMVIEDIFSEREYQKVMKKLQKEIEKEEQKYYREQKKKSKGFGSKRFGSKGFQ